MDPNIPALAATVATTLAPAIPYLVKGGEAAISEVSKKTVSALWDLFKPKAAKSPALADAITDVATSPEDPDSLAVLRVQIRKALDSDPELVSHVSPLIENAPTTTSQTVLGNQNITTGRDIGGNTITYNTPPKS